MGGNLSSKATKQTTKPTRITSQGISYNCHTFVGQGWKHCYRKALEAHRKLKLQRSHSTEDWPRSRSELQLKVLPPTEVSDPASC